jgi:hypothetical protein
VNTEAISSSGGFQPPRDPRVLVDSMAAGSHHYAFEDWLLAIIPFGASFTFNATLVIATALRVCHGESSVLGKYLWCAFVDRTMVAVQHSLLEDRSQLEATLR